MGQLQAMTMLENVGQAPREPWEAEVLGTNMRQFVGEFGWAMYTYYLGFSMQVADAIFDVQQIDNPAAAQSSASRRLLSGASYE
eukprot:CAMPEP_0174938528 /NCGR_PEP_ID=MMETSP1355-20121228/63781_1 /TAXON_ID=464990 /ORGANISM="Hemiselmis tepida, Strain CCMP443" /LENGTH=83 /DNA_ID=CAMNT_0016185461 /DNA_START=72 /DNA_END=320 /DNA_ORIENTATION=+